MSEIKRNKNRIMFSIEPELLEELDEYCDKNYVNRSQVICQSVIRTLNEQKVVDSIRDLTVSLRICAENGQIDPETRKDLESFQMLAKLFIK